MKTRNGFVSNSSTSSFIMLGDRIKLSKQLKQKVEDQELDLGDEGNIAAYYLDSRYYAIGCPLASWSDDGAAADGEHPLENLAALAVEVKQDVKEMLGIDIEPKLIFGTRGC